MKLRVLVAAIAVAGLATTALAAGGNVRSAAMKSEIRAMKQELQKARAEASASAFTSDEVGDADSFGRNAKWIGLMGSGTIVLTTFAEECLPENFPAGPDDHCVVLNPQPALTTFNFPDVARMTIPAKTSNSLFCHLQTPISSTFLNNTTAAPMNTALIVYNPVFTFENAVLADPALINPITGMPFAGSLTTTLPGIRHQLTLQPGESFAGRNDETRVCINGMISKRQLMLGFGLSEAQATEFFKHDTIVTMGITGQARGVLYSTMINNVRWLGD